MNCPDITRADVVTDSKSTSVDSLVKVTCSPGLYFNTGDLLHQLICLSYGNWSSEIPPCQGKVRLRGFILAIFNRIGSNVCLTFPILIMTNIV